MFRNEISFENHERGFEVAKALLDEHYVVLLSYEENLLIVNYEYSHISDRNDVVFMSRDEYEEETDGLYGSIREDVMKDLAFEGRLK